MPDDFLKRVEAEMASRKGEEKKTALIEQIKYERDPDSVPYPQAPEPERLPSPQEAMEASEAKGIPAYNRSSTPPAPYTGTKISDLPKADLGGDSPGLSAATDVPIGPPTELDWLGKPHAKKTRGTGPLMDPKALGDWAVSGDSDPNFTVDDKATHRLRSRGIIKPYGSVDEYLVGQGIDPNPRLNDATTEAQALAKARKRAEGALKRARKTYEMTQKDVASYAQAHPSVTGGPSTGWELLMRIREDIKQTKNMTKRKKLRRMAGSIKAGMVLLEEAQFAEENPPAPQSGIEAGIEGALGIAGRFMPDARGAKLTMDAALDPQKEHTSGPIDSFLEAKRQAGHDRANDPNDWIKTMATDLLIMGGTAALSRYGTARLAAQRAARVPPPTSQKLLRAPTEMPPPASAVPEISMRGGFKTPKALLDIPASGKTVIPTDAAKSALVGGRTLLQDVSAPLTELETAVASFTPAVRIPPPTAPESITGKIGQMAAAERARILEISRRESARKSLDALRKQTRTDNGVIVDPTPNEVTHPGHRDGDPSPIPDEEIARAREFESLVTPEPAKGPFPMNPDLKGPAFNPESGMALDWVNEAKKWPIFRSETWVDIQNRALDIPERDFLKMADLPKDATLAQKLNVFKRIYRNHAYKTVQSIAAQFHNPDVIVKDKIAWPLSVAVAESGAVSYSGDEAFFSALKALKKATKTDEALAASLERMRLALDKAQLPVTALTPPEKALFDVFRKDTEAMRAYYAETYGKNPDEVWQDDYFPHMTREVFRDPDGNPYLPEEIKNTLTDKVTTRWHNQRTDALADYEKDPVKVWNTYHRRMWLALHLDRAMKKVKPVIDGTLSRIASGKTEAGGSFVTGADIRKLKGGRPDVYYVGDEYKGVNFRYEESGNHFRLVEKAERPNPLTIPDASHKRAVTLKGREGLWLPKWTKRTRANGEVVTYRHEDGSWREARNVAPEYNKIMIRQGGLRQMPDQEFRTKYAQNYVERVLYGGRPMGPIMRRAHGAIYQALLGMFINTPTAGLNWIGGTYNTMSRNGPLLWMRGQILQKTNYAGDPEAKAFMKAMKPFIKSEGIHTELEAFGAQGKGQAARSLAKKVWSGGFLTFGAVEYDLRAGAAISEFLKARSAGAPVYAEDGTISREIILQALKGVAETQFLYDISTQPNIYQVPYLRHFFMLQSYPMRWRSQLLKDIEILRNTKSAATRKEMSFRLFRRLALAAAIGGATAAVTGSDTIRAVGEDLVMPGRGSVIPGFGYFQEQFGSPLSNLAMEWIPAAVKYVAKDDEFALADAYMKTRSTLIGSPTAKRIDVARWEPGDPATGKPAGTRKYDWIAQNIFGAPSAGKITTPTSKRELELRAWLPGTRKSLKSLYDARQKTRADRLKNTNIRKAARAEILQEIADHGVGTQRLADLLKQHRKHDFKMGSLLRDAHLLKNQGPVEAEIMLGAKDNRLETMLTFYEEGVITQDELKVYFWKAFKEDLIETEMNPRTGMPINIDAALIPKRNSWFHRTLESSTLDRMIGALGQ